MADRFDLVLSRFRNMLTKITEEDADFDDLCKTHNELRTESRVLNAHADPTLGQRDQELRKSRAALEEQMLAIVQANTRV